MLLDEFWFGIGWWDSGGGVGGEGFGKGEGEGEGEGREVVEDFRTQDGKEIGECGKGYRGYANLNCLMRDLFQLIGWFCGLVGGLDGDEDENENGGMRNEDRRGRC